PKRDYADPFYRRDRAYRNALETSPALIGVILAAILAGAAPFWINLLAAIFILSRIAMAYVHIRTENQNLRSMCYGVGWFSIVLTGIFALVAVF
ncbi:MAG: MAPEG family protein, partial [Sulfitobacter sp.]